jgi:CheY-like chemotaxis protein
MVLSALALSRSSLVGLRVLVVDDNADMLWLLRTMLGAYGAEVVTAASAREGLAALSSSSFDVLVSDISMPGEDGYSLIRDVRALAPDRGGRTPALAMTSFAGLYDRARSLAAGFQAHLPKDAQPEEVVSTVARLAGR